MENKRLLECFETDAARLRNVVAEADLAAPVPTCPDWTIDDLLRHVAVVYLHKVECMRVGSHPHPWPPPGLDDEEPLALFDRAYAALSAEFAAREPQSRAFTWFTPDQTVEFWIRRMAQETLIHRVDAELAVGMPIAPIPADLAHDGIDEILVTMVEFGSRTWPDAFAEILRDAPGSVTRLETPELAWWVRPTPRYVEVGAGAGVDAGAGADAGDGDGGTVGAVVRGDPANLMLWLWNRAGDDAVRTSGDASELARLRRILVASTG